MNILYYYGGQVIDSATHLSSLAKAEAFFAKKYGSSGVGDFHAVCVDSQGPAADAQAAAAKSKTRVLGKMTRNRLNQFRVIATMTRSGDRLTVDTAVTGDTSLKTRFSMAIPVAKQALADRLVRAIDSGKAFGGAEVCVDVDGEFYLHLDWRVRGRYLASDLQMLGF